MKKILQLFLGLLCSCFLFGQRVGIGTATPDASAMLDIYSQTRGVLFPRMSTPQRQNIIAPQKGLLVFDTDSSALMHFDGAQFLKVGAPAGSGFTLPYNNSTSAAGTSFNVSNTGSGGGLKVVASGGDNIWGVYGYGSGTGAYGVRGTASSNLGYGVYGYATTFGTVGVSAYAQDNGIALRGNSPTGIALYTNGAINISGGNTNPANGSLLTCIDANGNAVWKPLKEEKIAFRLKGITNGLGTLSSNVGSKVHFESINYNYGGYASYTNSGVPVTANASTFTVGVTGSYAFDLQVGTFVGLQQVAITSMEVNLVCLRAGNTIILAKQRANFGAATDRDLFLRCSTQKKLFVGDVVYVTVKQTESTNQALTLDDNTSFFSGYLVHAE